MKAILKKSISIVICVAMMLTALPMIFASAEDTAIPEPLLLAKGIDEDGYYHPGGYSTCEKTFDAQVASDKTWSNNMYLSNDTGFDLSDYNAVTFTLWYDSQDNFNFWKDYLFFIIQDTSGVLVAYPVDTTINSTTPVRIVLDLDYAVAKGLDKSAICRIGIRSFRNGQFRNQLRNWDVGFYTTDETAPDIRVALRNFCAEYIPEAEGTVEVHPGNYVFYDAESQNRDYVTWQTTLSEAVDVSGCDYLSVKLNMSDIEALKADMGSLGTKNIFGSLRLRIGTSASYYTLSFDAAYIKDGFNEILIPISTLGSHASGITFIQMYIEPHAGTGNVPTKPYMYGITDIKGVKDVVPEAVTARARVDIPVPTKFVAVNTSTWLQDRYFGSFETPVDISSCDYIEFDYWVNSDMYAEILAATNPIGIAFGSNSDTSNSGKYSKRLTASFQSQIKNAGWNHIVLRIADMSKEAGFDNTISQFYFYSSGTATTTPLCVNAANVCATVHAGDVNGDTEVNINDLIRMKKVIANATSDYDALALDVNNDGITDYAADLVYLRQYLLGEVEL